MHDKALLDYSEIAYSRVAEEIMLWNPACTEDLESFNIFCSQEMTEKPQTLIHPKHRLHKKPQELKKCR